jgi:hypothetical protein
MVDWQQHDRSTGSGGGGRAASPLTASQQPPGNALDRDRASFSHATLPVRAAALSTSYAPHSPAARISEARMELMTAAGLHNIPRRSANSQPAAPALRPMPKDPHQRRPSVIAGARHAVPAKLHPSRCCHSVPRQPQPSRDREGAVVDERNAAARPNPPHNTGSVVGARQPQPGIGELGN